MLAGTVLDHEFQAALDSFDRGSDPYLFDDCGHQHLRPLLDARLQTHLCKGAIEQLAHSSHAAKYDRACTAIGPDHTRL